MNTLLLVGDLCGIFFFAVSGSLLAARKGFDIIGSLALAYMTGLGGGIIRDLIIDQGVPNSFVNTAYLLPPFLATIAVYLLSTHIQKLRYFISLFDAGGLALFCITGTLTALAAGIQPIVAVLLGVATACGGGLLRDITANETPSLFNPRDLYAVPAFLGSGTTVLLMMTGWFNLLTATITAIVVFVLRMLALRFGWSAPLAVRGWSRPRIRLPRTRTEVPHTGAHDATSRNKAPRFRSDQDN